MLCQLLRPTVVLTLQVALVAGGTVAPAANLPQRIDFDKHIRPIFTQHCTACHGGVKQASDLSLIYEEGLLRVVDPDSPDDSLLIRRVTAENDEDRMPPPVHGPRLSDSEVTLLKEWVKQGARWSQHWAYQAPERHGLPTVSDSAWCRQPIDHFVLAGLDERGVKPADDELPERWLRRATFDLTGVPPTLEERAAFLQTLDRHGERAYEKVVDRLLASPRFGERWASVWFDQVRYADSRGQGEDSPRDIWKYRDWVIRSLNRDMPYDEFTIKQIAGDLLPHATIEDHVATAVHRLTQTNEEGGTDDEEFRVAAVLDRVHTTWQAWQGTTMGCVQCHDHPYDPIRHDEYYRFMAYFNNTADCDLSDDWPTLAVPLDESEYERASQLDQQIRRITESQWRSAWQATHHKAAWQPLRIARVSSSNETRVVVVPQTTHDEYQTTGTVASNPTITVELPLPDNLDRITGIRFTALPLQPATALPDAEVGAVLSHIEVSIRSAAGKDADRVKLVDVVGDEPFPYFAPAESLQPSSGGFGAYTRMHHPRSAVLLLETPIEYAPGATLIVKSRYGIFDLAAFSLVARRGFYAVSSDSQLTEWQHDTTRIDEENRLRELVRERSAIDLIAIPVMAERPSHLARPSHVFERGLYLTKGQRVEPGVPAALNLGGKSVPDRRSLAEWLVSDDNPLAARVAVNRYWARMFGIGLVATEEDFGSAGERPSHPELFDDLAVRFRDDYGWSVKQLLREIALSRTYRQSSRLRADIADRDPLNRWLARGPRHTLPAEAIRDQMLAISGLLNLKMYGPPVHPPLPPGAWKARRGTWDTPPVGHEDRYRRTVYTYVKRSIPFPTSEMFDVPSRDVCTPRRLRSNTPLQPLMLLNDSAYVECAHAFADQMTAHSEQVREQLEYGWLRATTRQPRPEEVARLMELYQQTAASSGDHVALQGVAAVLLNLDEILTK